MVPAAAAADAPDGWDPRVTDYARFVERARGLEFEHPVRVQFLSERAFRRAAATWYAQPTSQEREDAERRAADLLALGLVTERFDVLAATEVVDTSATLGWYDEEREEMVVRGTDVDDVDVQLTIVHELTHVLQDQHFDLSRLDARASTAGELAAVGALIEGDATLVEQKFLASKPRAVQDAYRETLAADDDARATADGRAAWPLVYDLWAAFEYDLAPTALGAVVAEHGRAGVDDLFRSPPRSEEAIVDPVALAQDDRPRRVALPRFEVGERPRGPADDVGAFSLYLVLSARIPWRDALRAVDGWGGDRVRSYRQATEGGERGCVKLAVVGDTEADTRELDRAFRRWARAMPDGAASVGREGDRVVVAACATGVAPTSGDDAMQRAYDRLWERTDRLRRTREATARATMPGW